MSSGQGGFMTRALHSEGHGKPMHAHSMPIFQTSTFAFESPEHGADLFARRRTGHIYTRIGNPTVEAFEAVVANLEGGEASVAFASGLAAIFGTLMSSLQAGDHVLSGDTLYGPSLNQIERTLTRYGIEATFVDTSDPAAVERGLRETTRVVFLETPANPTCRITEIRRVSELARRVKALVVVDATFATPCFLRPLEWGADVSLHSTTKFINGHGDAVGGVVTTAAALAERIRKFRTDTGACCSPFDAWLNLRGLRTLALRMERHDRNALAVAGFLASHPGVSRVHYHGLPGDPGHAAARREMSGFGSTFAFEMAGGYESAKRLLERIRMMTLAVSLGTLDTLIQHPASMTHASISEEMMRRQGLTPGMVRIHVGLEDDEDIIEDLRQALEGVQ
ncbi:MAG: aminotransferase class I/II-fold pyridoxal phosphate-dependent enzyme [Candidatus Eisenbacteria bacterium]|uniref:Aminotransferase class I/II-fold pyridoxal phosphate-dependent enzyme n=1 Tax=Eiseniibacteriota bacterium TaxID=2212470 RepID=A0A937XB04_UNCEI|nr:aminotransferase class I/II-fold pyridoxal phosphate-dependent enzyme [Candidatus Eisenbacteria bacterium]